MPYVRESWFDGEQFTGLAHARRSAEEWWRDIAGMRIHGTTRKVPREIFEAAEKETMLPPPEGLYDVPARLLQRSSSLQWPGPGPSWPRPGPSRSNSAGLLDPKAGTRGAMRPSCLDSQRPICRVDRKRRCCMAS